MRYIQVVVVNTNLKFVSLSKKMYQILADSSLKRRQLDSQRQNIWAIASGVVAVALLYLPFEANLGEAAANLCRIFASSFAAVCAVGAVYYGIAMFLCPSLPRETEK
jgi:hypothetical protein